MKFLKENRVLLNFLQMLVIYGIAIVLLSFDIGDGGYSTSFHLTQGYLVVSFLFSIGFCYLGAKYFVSSDKPRHEAYINAWKHLRQVSYGFQTTHDMGEEVNWFDHDELIKNEAIKLSREFSK